MPVYEYKGLNGKGKEVKGIMDAESAGALKAALKKEGIFLTQYSDSNKGSSKGVVSGSGGKDTAAAREFSFKKMLGRVKIGEVAEATRQLATLLRASVPITDSLGAIAEQVENERLQTIYSQVRKEVNEGSSLAKALGQHPKVFNNLYINMVAAGEQSGNLDLVFERLADFTESQQRLKGKIKSAMAYPIVMAIAAFGIVMLLMVFVVPKMTEMFTEMGSELPLVTRILIAMSNTFIDWWWLIIIGVAGLVYGFRRWKNSKKGRAKWDRFKLRAPVFGIIVRLTGVARFSRTLSTLLSSGVNLLSAMGIVKEVVDNVMLSEVVDNARDAIREGESIARPLERSGQFPPMVTHMIAIGEKTGRLENMLGHVARNYEEQVESRVSTLTSVMEPLIILVMGGIVGFMVFAIMLPMLKMNEMIQGSM